jgi:hypothetical protein
MVAAIQAERVELPRRASIIAHSSGVSVILDDVTMRPLPEPAGLPAPSRFPPRGDFMFMFVIFFDWLQGD